jgi:hypothetical protein
MGTTRTKRLTPEQIATIQACVGSLRSVARELGVGKSTVDYHRQKVYDAWAAQESDEPEPFPTIEFVQLAKPRRCPKHGLVSVWPCVVCSSTQGG